MCLAFSFPVSRYALHPNGHWPEHDMPELPERASEPEPELHAGAGLRLRLWLACLAGAAITAAGVWWVTAAFLAPGLASTPSLAVISLLAAAGAGLAAGGLFAVWLDHRLVGHLRALARALRSGRVADLRDLPATSGWGELSEATRQAQERLAAMRQLERAAADLDELGAGVEGLREAVERWIVTERWEPLRLEAGPLAALGEALDRGLAREAEVRDQNEEVARRLRGDFESARGDARESAEQAERGFVEATALLTSVRELQRLSGDLQIALTPATVNEPAAPAADAQARWREAAAAAVAELVAASAESVERLGEGLRHVHSVADLVQRLSNRATLIALNVAIAGGRDPGAAEPAVMAEELKKLAHDVREATMRVESLSRLVDEEVAAATARMNDVRGRVAATLERLPEAPAEPPAPVADAARLMERVREMVQDATRKGERLSSAGERASRSAQRLVRRLEAQARELDGFVLRLAAPESPAAGEALPEEPRVPPAEAEDPRGGGLRLLGRDDDATAGDEPGAGPGRGPGLERRP